MQYPISASKAVLVGSLWINVPVSLLLFGPVVGCAVYIGRDAVERNEHVGLVIASFLVGFVLAWLWWSLSVPHWRIWAYSRVDNLEELKARAVRAAILWPEETILGRLFQRTEFRPANVRAQLTALETAHRKGKA